MADLDQRQVVAYVEGRCVLELSQLVKALESGLRVSAAAAVAVAARGWWWRSRRGGRRGDRSSPSR